MTTNSNIDQQVVSGFGDEWNRFNQSELSETELTDIFNGYFSIFPWEKIQANSTGFDLGCGSGRWAKLVAEKVGHLHCIDASELALNVAQKNLSQKTNCTFHLASVDQIPLTDGQADFGYSLGVLHHVPDTQKGIESCVNKLKQGAPFLLYLYYAFDNRPFWYRWIWQTTELIRALVSHSPNPIRYAISQVIALFVYLPLATTSKILDKLSLPFNNVPLSDYRNRSFYTMRTDALDRFGTQLEQRFTKDQIRQMMTEAGLIDIEFGSQSPYWCAIGYRK
jgi:ubiquinone/menaquinone biosynthesis C-methylase UbiE